MRVLVLVKDKFPIPLEQFPSLLDAFVDWRERYRDSMESFEFFAGSSGGFGIINVPDEKTLSRAMTEYPFFLFSEITVHPILDGDVALRQVREVMQQMMGGTD
jgi:hypothetical protein